MTNLLVGLLSRKSKTGFQTNNEKLAISDHTKLKINKLLNIIVCVLVQMFCIEG